MVFIQNNESNRGVEQLSVYISRRLRPANERLRQAAQKDCVPIVLSSVEGYA